MLIGAESFYVLNIAADSPSSIPSLVVGIGHMRDIETLNQPKQSVATNKSTTRITVRHTLSRRGVQRTYSCDFALRT
jgi:hypothetical protein